MTFFNPLLLLAVAGIALPILAHLLNRYKVKQTDWAAMRFLNRSVRVRSRQLRLRDLLLLIMRCLAVILIALAIARPTMDHPTGPAAWLGERNPGVVIAVDASYSMRHKDAGETRFDRALQAVRQIVDGVTPGSPVSLVVLGNEHRVVARQMAFDPDRFEAILATLEPTDGRLRLETVPPILAELVAETVASQTELHIVTDLQRGDWQDPPKWLRDALTDLADQAETFIVPVQGKPGAAPANLAVTEFELFAGLLRKGTTARYSATVQNDGAAAATGVNVKCYMGDNVVDSKVIPTIAPRSSQTVSFFVPFENAGPVTLSARLDDDALPLDNTRRAVANIRERVSILSVEGGSISGGLESFTVKALRARGSDASKEEYNVRSVSWLSLPSQDLSQFDVVVLSDVPEITKAQAELLNAHVRAGGGLIWFGGPNVKTAVWNERVALDGGSLLPAAIGEPMRVGGAVGTRQPLDPDFPDHPVCRSLRSLPKDLLSETQFDRMLAVTPSPSSSTLLKLSGNDTPVLIEQSIGRGHVFMFTSSADPSWNNMALTPVFPMLLQQMVTYLTGREFERPRLVGNSLSLSYAERPDANDGMFETPSGRIIRVPVREHDGEFVAFLDRSYEAGFYQARVSLQQPGQPIAVNLDTRESDVRTVDPAAAQAALDDTGVTVTPSYADHAGGQRTGRAFWRALLIIGLLMLVAEGLLASNLIASRIGRRRKRRTAQTPAALGEAA